MIDFRYHLVSLVAVFLALATGIVIGATSLRGQVVGTLSDQVQQLRGEKQQLRSRLDESTLTAARQDQLVADVNPAVLEGRLRGRTVAVVVLPGTPARLVGATTTSLRTAGATVGVTAELDDAWSGRQVPGGVREAAAAMAMDTGAVPDDRLGGLVLAQALTTRPGEPVSAQQQRGAAVLRERGLLGGPGTERPAPSSSVVVLWPQVPEPTDVEDPTLKAWGDLVTALGLSGRPVVGVCAGAGGSGDGDALVAALRDSAQATGSMSTVDDGSRAAGQTALVLALREEYAGRGGHYGLDRDAAAAAPPLGRR